MKEQTYASFNAQNEENLSDISEHFINLRKSNPKNFLLAHININSLQNKFDELRVILDNNLVDCLYVSESKLNDSHSDSLFQIPNYHMYRKDNKHDNGGGLICFIRSDIPSYEEKIDSHPCENLTIVAHIESVKWIFIGVYRKPSIPENSITTYIDLVIDKCQNITENIVAIGDMNCNMLKSGINAVQTLCSDHNLHNIVSQPTCYKANPPTLLDVILVSNKEQVKKSQVIPCPLSDFHHFIVAILTPRLTRTDHKRVKYRSYKHFDTEHFKHDLARAPFHVGECLDVHDQCDFVTKLYSDILNEHAPLKTKTIKKKQSPYMNSEWRKAIHKKHQLFNRYWKVKSQSNWHQYRKQRNLCTKLRKSSMRDYMQEKCAKAKVETRNFWQMVSPYFATKSCASNSIQLIDNDRFVIKPQEIAEIFNDKFAAVADTIGNDSRFKDDLTGHPSLNEIDNRVKDIQEFNFAPTNVTDVKKIIDRVNANRSCGYDSIPPAMWKTSSDIMSPVVCNIAN